jgi:hypothetical protein
MSYDKKSIQMLSLLIKRTLHISGLDTYPNSKSVLMFYLFLQIDSSCKMQSQLFAFLDSLDPSLPHLLSDYFSKGFAAVSQFGFHFGQGDDSTARDSSEAYLAYSKTNRDARFFT